VQPNGECVQEIDDCLVSPDFYTVTINNEFACPACDDSMTFDLDSLECVDCESLGCKTCDNYGKCLSCPTFTFLFDGICISEDENCKVSPDEYVLINDMI